MVQARENWSELSGAVERQIEPDAGQGFIALEVRVQGADPVEDYPNFLANELGAVVQLRLPPSALSHPPRPGERIRARVRMVGPGVYFGGKEGVIIG